MRQRALELKEQTVRYRRYLHDCAEVGLHMPKTMAYLKEQLRLCGIEPKTCGHGLMADVGSGENCILLRADADALENGHTCGHDCHAAMLLTAAQMLKEEEQKLCGRVRLMFQPAEETLQGAQDMLHSGILEPRPQAAVAFHTAAGKLPPGMALCGSDGVMMRSADHVVLTFRGKGGHGAYAEKTADPIKMAVQTYRELPDVTFGCIQAGTTGNVIPETAVLKGTVRAEENRWEKLERLKQTAQRAAQEHGGSVTIERPGGTPALKCHKGLTLQMGAFLRELGLIVKDGVKAKASEDFAYIAREIPSAYFYLTCGFPDARGDHLAHDPLVQIDEEVLPLGAAAYAHCAMAYLKNVKK